MRKFVTYLVSGFFGLLSVAMVAWAGYCINQELAGGINLESVATSFVLFIGGMVGCVGIKASIGAVEQEEDRQ